ncbi:Tetratricopeptide repeat protein 27 [Thelohanellus kitauei]|uniref:Tetratricopeptide repeat protein 27 n=1 Tax=Thelohanellus kitauei TaxID=669202 RepID=A0A0C2MMV7_THEKT|nr:Tetratricopeptide repeat protein 27 [Thelohanellus kitauei]
MLGNREYLLKFREIKNIEKKIKSTDFYHFSQFCLEHFYINNFCGPLTDPHEILNMFGLSPESLEKIESFCRLKLSEVGDDIRSITHYPFMLWIATICLKLEANTLDQNVHQLLILLVWSQLFDSPISSLKDSVFQRVEFLLSHIKSEESSERNSILIMCLQSYLLFKEFDMYEELIQCISGDLGIKVKLTGILGKRTKYQIKALPQLALNVHLEDSYLKEESENVSLPEDVVLDDDTLLPKIHLSIDNPLPSLSVCHQSFLLLICYYKINSLPIDDLTHEELLPYINSILESPKSYTVARNALYYRSLFERSSRRKLERTLQQLEELLADTYFQIRCVKSALDQYTELKAYDELVKCYIACGRREKYAECVDNFVKALNINSLQPKTWYNLGCAYLQLKQDAKAASAFKSCCHLEPSNFKSWTNLASIFIAQNSYQTAYIAVQNAISCNFDSEQIWLMYAHVSNHSKLILADIKQNTYLQIYDASFVLL